MFKLKIIHWNCFSLTVARNFELKQFLATNKPDLLLLQEIKLDNEAANMRLRYEGYATYHKVRIRNPGSGGGVAILINEKISHTPIMDIEESLELIGLKIELNNFTLDVFSYYNPPGSIVSKSLFDCYLNNGKNFILLGDLNSKCAATGCKKTNQSGKVLEEILENSDLVLFNDDTPTYNSYSDESYWEILDLAIGSSSLVGLSPEFKVLEENITSDHNIVSIDLKINGSVRPDNGPYIPRYNFAKANWPSFYVFLQDYANSTDSNLIDGMKINKLNSTVTHKILEAADKSIPKFKKSNRKSFPIEILSLIRERNRLRKMLKTKKKKSPELKQEYNRISGIVRQEINKYESNKWNNFLKDLGPYPVKSSKFWKKINETKKVRQTSSIPNLILDGTEFITDEDKACLFSSILKKTFSENGAESDYDKQHKSEVTETVDSINLGNCDFTPFNTIEIIKVIKQTKINSAPGADGIQNTFLKKLPYEFIDKILIKLINRSAEFGMPDEWKKATITMIPKKAFKSKNPSDYRPISLLSCLGKVTEKLVRNRLYKFLEEINFFVEQQSGFRNNRGASDNLLFFTQKISENIQRGRKACGIFFDISKAFDNIWHNGVIYQLNEIGAAKYLIKFVKDFMSNRKFRVKINNVCGEYCEIECGLAQGSAISPLLFLVFINSIPIANSKKTCYSSLFADDLGAIFTFKKPTTAMNNTIKHYLENLVKWLFKWRLKMNAKKCCYTIFSKAGNKNSRFVKKIVLDLKLNCESIPYDPNPQFLGITFDEHLCFNKHIDILKDRALKRIKIIKLISHNSWHLNSKTLTNIYNALVGSIFLYSFFMVANASETNLEKLQKIQNQAVRHIFKLGQKYPTHLLYPKSKVLPVKDRLISLGCKRLTKSLSKNENTKILVKEYIESVSSIRRDIGVFTPLCLFLPIIALAQLKGGLMIADSMQE